MVDLVATLQVRNVPDHVSQVLKERAAKAGQSLSEYALAQLTAITERPTLDEWMARVAAREAVDPTPSVAEALRAGRAERNEQEDQEPS